MNLNPKRIAILLPSLKFGGAERVTISLAKAFQTAPTQVDILVMSLEGEYLAEAQSHFNVINLDCNKTYKLPGKLLSYLVQNRPDALISNFWKLNLCACMARLVYPWFRLILWEHSPPSKSDDSPTWLFAISASIFYQASTKVVTVSSGVFKDIDRITFGLRRKMVVIFNPIEPPSPNVFQSKADNGHQRRVIWVGRLDGMKNPELMLEAFSLVSTTSNAFLTIVGDGHLRAQLEAKCKTLRLEHRVSFLGYQSYPYAEMASSDLLVLTSDHEGLPSVIIEAMLCGLRVVSTDCGEGVHDILLGSRHGTVVPARDARALARAIETELLTTFDPEEQIAGARRFLPAEVSRQFLLAMNANLSK